MNRAAAWCCCAALLGPAACRQTDEGGELNPTGSRATGGNAGHENATATEGARASQAGAMDAPGGGGTENGVAPGVNTNLGGQGGPDEEPAAGGACGTASEDGECAHCLATECCSAWQACEEDDDCAACTECLNAQMDLGECVVMGLCDIAPDATSTMLVCGLEPCEQECGFD